VLPPLPEPDALGEWSTLPKGCYLPEREFGNYLLLRFGGQSYVRPVSELPSQYLRRWLAGPLGSKSWDWRAAANEMHQQLARARRLYEPNGTALANRS